MILLVSAAAGYLLGALPSGVLVCRLLGKDPRQVGSGRTGGTNVYRTAGMPAAVLTVALDVLKGAAGAWLGFALAGIRVAPFATAAVRAAPGAEAAWLAASVGALAAIVGHNYSVFAGFKGGAGSSPNLGAVLVLDPMLGLIGFGASFVMLFGVRIASLASLTLSLIVALGGQWQIMTGAAPATLGVYTWGQLLLVAWALRPNIRRLLAGEERRIEFGRRAEPPDPAPKGPAGPGRASRAGTAPAVRSAPSAGSASANKPSGPGSSPAGS